MTWGCHLHLRFDFCSAAFAVTSNPVAVTCTVRRQNIWTLFSRFLQRTQFVSRIFTTIFALHAILLTCNPSSFAWNVYRSVPVTTIGQRESVIRYQTDPKLTRSEYNDARVVIALVAHTINHKLTVGSLRPEAPRLTLIPTQRDVCDSWKVKRSRRCRPMQANWDLHIYKYTNR